MATSSVGNIVGACLDYRERRSRRKDEKEEVDPIEEIKVVS